MNSNTDNISSVKNCYGCGVCAIACGKKIIDIKLNKKGFYEPYITDQSKCTNCRLCLDVCAFVNHDSTTTDNPNIKGYASWSDNKNVRSKCTSGGTAFEIGKQLIEQGYKACGVRYNPETERAEHFMASTVEAFLPSIGSKYMQSYTIDGFKHVNKREKFLITGTPCQIASFRRYIQRFKIEDNFILLDFFCHSVPSMLIWKKYKELVERKTGKITHASWRNKVKGRHESWSEAIEKGTKGEYVGWHKSLHMIIQGEDTFHSWQLCNGDLYFNLFIGGYAPNTTCTSQCKYRGTSSFADIRVGDLWGNTYKDNDDGVTGLVAFTDKGDDVIKNLNNCTLIEHSFETVAEGQMMEDKKTPYLKPIANMLFKIPYNNIFMWKLLLFVERKIKTSLKLIK